MAFIAWIFIGCCVMAALDDEGMELLDWAKACPFGGVTATAATWPVWLVIYFKNRQ